tara:strand:+ start:45 stop:605 length:561 start_codon:yes stop_codon:yes gene_type:complete
MLHTVAKICIVEGKSDQNLNWLSEFIASNPINLGQSLVSDKVIDEMSKLFYEKEGLHITPIRYWGDFHERNMSTQECCYSGGDNPPHVTAILCVSAPEGSGEIVFRPKINSYCLDFCSTSFSIQTGTFYMFPSYLNHYMTRHCSDQKRVLFSVNYAIINPDTSKQEVEPVEPPPIVNPGNGLRRFP